MYTWRVKTSKPLILTSSSWRINALWQLMLRSFQKQNKGVWSPKINSSKWRRRQPIWTVSGTTLMDLRLVDMDFSPNFVVPETSHPKHPWQLVQPKCFLLLSCLTLFCPSRGGDSETSPNQVSKLHLWKHQIPICGSFLLTTVPWVPLKNTAKHGKKQAESKGSA